MPIYKRRGSDNWYMSYRDAAGILHRRSTRTTDAEKAEAILGKTLAKVDATKRRRWTKSLDELGPKEHPAGTLDERVLQLEDIVGRVMRLHIIQYEVLREWIENEMEIQETE